MPEGDTIFRTARALEKALGGRVVTHFEASVAKLASANDNTPLVGRAVERVEARGKWCVMVFSGDLILLSHMLMSGSWHVYRTGERWRQPYRAMRCVITCGEMQAVLFNAQVAEFHTQRSLERHPLLPKLGPDILSAAFTQDAGVAALRDFAAVHPDTEVGDTLLNQRVLAGLGNVYKSEVAFAAGVHPFRAAGTLTEREMQKMVELAERYMQANVKDGAGDGIVTYSGPRRTTASMTREDRLWVYGRQGQECRRCGTAIQMRKQGTGARSTYWCAQCQPWVGEKAEPVGRANVIRRRKIGC